MKIDKKGVDVEVAQFIDRDVESPIEIHLAQGIARGENGFYCTKSRRARN